MSPAWGKVPAIIARGPPNEGKAGQQTTFLLIDLDCPYAGRLVNHES